MSERKKANEEYKQAKANLDANAEKEKRKGIRHETDEYLRLNREVAKAEKKASWWHR